MPSPSRSMPHEPRVVGDDQLVRASFWSWSVSRAAKRQRHLAGDLGQLQAAVAVDVGQDEGLPVLGRRVLCLRHAACRCEQGHGDRRPHAAFSPPGLMTLHAHPTAAAISRPRGGGKRPAGTRGRCRLAATAASAMVRAQSRWRMEGRTDAAPEPDRRRVGEGGRSAATSTRPTPTTWSASTRRPTRRRRGTAIAAAKAAFPAGGRPRPQQRADALDKIGNEILARKDELGRLLSREEGKTLPEGIGEATRAGQIFKFFAGEALRLGGELLPSVRPGVGVEITREPVGVVGHHHALELPDRDPGLEDRAGAGLRQLRGVQARRPGAGLRLGAGRDHQPRRRCRKGVFNLVMGRGSVVGQALLDIAGRRRHQLHRLGRHRPRASPQAASTRMAQVPARDGRQEPAGRARRRRPRRSRSNCAVKGAFFSTGQRCTASSRADRRPRASTTASSAALTERAEER